MRKWVALVLGVLVPLLGLAGVGSAQSTVQVQGTIQAVDCQNQTIVVATPTSTNTIAVAPYTAVLVDSRAVSLRDLQQYVGSPATIWLVANGNEFIATRVDTTAQAAVAPVALSAQQEAIAPLPLAGIVLGTIILAGLIYLLVRDSQNRYYRYPYYGEYYRYYYRPEYRSYAGWYPVTACPVVFAAVPITGIVLGVTVFNGFDYLLVRSYDGRYERYPYYGPYRAYYYRPEYRVYGGPVIGDAPVRYGDPRGTVLYHRTDDPRPGPVQYQPQPRQYQQPYNYQQPPQTQPYQRPAYTPVPPRPGDTDRGTAPRYQQQYQQPPYQTQPRQYQQPYNYQQAPQYQRQPYGNPQPYQHPAYTPVPPRPGDTDRGTSPRYQQQYQQPPQYRPNQQYQQYQQYQHPSYSPVRNGDGGARGRDSRQVCQTNQQGQSCSDGSHNR